MKCHIDTILATLIGRLEKMNNHLLMGGKALVAWCLYKRHACNVPSTHDTHAQRASHAIQDIGEPAPKQNGT